MGGAYQLLGQITPIESKAEYYLVNLKKAYREGNYADHKKYSDTLLSWSKKHHLPKMEVRALVNQGIFFHNRNENQKSILLYHEALKKTAQIKDDPRLRAIVLVNLGNTYQSIGEYDKSNDPYQEAIELTQKADGESQRITAAIFMALSNNYGELNQTSKAKEYAEKTLEIGETIGDEDIIAAALMNLCDTAFDDENFEDVIIMGERSLTMNYLKKPTEKRGWILLKTAIAHLRLNQLEKSKTLMEDAKALASAHGFLEMEMECEKHLAEYYTTTGNYELSNKSQKAYIELKEAYLKNNNSASKLDIEHQLKEQQEELDFLGRNNSFLKFLGLGGMLLLGLGTVYFVRHKKRSKALLEQNRIFENEIANYHKKPTVSDSLHLKTEKTKESSSYKNSSLSKDDHERYKMKILEVMQREKPHLNPDLKLGDLAKIIEMSPHHVSEILHFGFAQNFYNFINSYRVICAKNLMKEDIVNDKKILAIALESGFKSKSSFNRVFKSHTGQTPSEFKSGLPH